MILKTSEENQLEACKNDKSVTFFRKLQSNQSYHWGLAEAHDKLIN